MGFFNFFMKNSIEKPPKSESKYYQPESYYKNSKANGDPVITFDERKRISYPTHRGLFVAEVLLLEYCSYGTYPHPENGYPGFWWFEYGIRDVGKHLLSLEQRGYIRKALPHESVQSLTVPTLKEILVSHDLPVTGKKSELINRVLGNIDFDELTKMIGDPKYMLTGLGVSELQENYYIPLIHKNKNNGNYTNLFGDGFDVWEVNLRLHERPGALWQDILNDMLPEGVVWQYENKNKLEVLL